jgi:hypothetical protein
MLKKIQEWFSGETHEEERKTKREAYNMEYLSIPIKNACLGMTSPCRFPESQRANFDAITTISLTLMLPAISCSPLSPVADDDDDEKEENPVTEYYAHWTNGVAIAALKKIVIKCGDQSYSFTADFLFSQFSLLGGGEAVNIFKEPIGIRKTIPQLLRDAEKQQVFHVRLPVPDLPLFLDYPVEVKVEFTSMEELIIANNENIVNLTTGEQLEPYDISAWINFEAIESIDDVDQFTPGYYDFKTKVVPVDIPVQEDEEAPKNTIRLQIEGIQLLVWSFTRSECMDKLQYFNKSGYNGGDVFSTVTTRWTTMDGVNTANAQPSCFYRTVTSMTHFGNIPAAHIYCKEFHESGPSVIMELAVPSQGLSGYLYLHYTVAEETKNIKMERIRLLTDQ